MELDEALAQWKTRTHIQKYVYDVSSKVSDTHTHIHTHTSHTQICIQVYITGVSV
jgi:hypothetical protein